MNLHDLIRRSLRQSNPSQGAMWDNHSPITSADPNETAIHNVNYYLRNQLGRLQHQTRGRALMDVTRAREVLEDDVTIEQWMAGFDQFVRPVITYYGLPDWQTAR